MERKEIIRKFEEVVVKREKEIEETEKMFTNPIFREFLSEDKRRNTIMRQALELLKREGAEAQEEKRYRLKLKPEIADFFRQPTRCSYLNLEKSTGKYSIIGVVEIGDYKTKFTESEIAEMKFPDGVSLDMFEKVEVE